MSTLALIIVLFAAFLHAFWNLLVKRASGGLPLLWLAFVWMVVGFAPVTAYILIVEKPVLGIPELAAMAVNGVLQLAYFYLLNQSYRFGDMSLVYPLARGSGPLLVTIYAIAFLNETPGPIAVMGTLLLAAGVLMLSANFRELRASGAYKGVAYALLTGCSIALYTLWDRHAVRDLDIHPLLYLWAGALGQMLIVLPYALRHRDEVRAAWRDHWLATAGIGIISVLAYALILFAMTFTQVSYVAPAREISVLIGAVMGSRVLSEKPSPGRVAASVAMVAGLIALALG